jgi:methyl-accepting chemotaxis protein
MFKKAALSLSFKVNLLLNAFLIIPAISVLIFVNTKISQMSSSQSAQTCDNLILDIAVLLLIAVIIGLLLSNYLTRRLIKKPIKSITAAMEKMAQGDCDIRVTVNSRDEIGMLTSSLITLAENIREEAERYEFIDIYRRYFRRLVKNVRGKSGCYDYRRIPG